MARVKKTTKPEEITVTPVVEAEATELAPVETTAPKLKSRKMSFKKLTVTDLEVTPPLEPVPQQEVSHIQLEPETATEAPVAAVVDAPADNVIDVNQTSEMSASEASVDPTSSEPQTFKAKGIKQAQVLEFSMDMKEYLARQEKVMEELTVMMRHVYNHTKRSQTLAKMRITFFIIIGIIFALIGAVFAPTFKKAFVQYNDVLKIGGGGVKSDTVETIFDKPK